MLFVLLLEAYPRLQMSNRLLHQQCEGSKTQWHNVIDNLLFCARFTLYLVFVKLTILLVISFITHLKLYNTI